MVSEPEPQEPPSARRLTVLLVDDEVLVQHVTRRMLEHYGYRVFVAATPQEAIDKVESEPESIDVVLTDLVMAGIDGPTLIRRLRERRDSLGIVYMSGYDPREIRERLGELPGPEQLLRKPFSPAQMQRAIEAAAPTPHEDDLPPAKTG